MRRTRVVGLLAAAWALGPLRPAAAAEVLLVTEPSLRAPLARALGDAGLTPAAEVPAEAPGRADALLAEAARAFAAMDAERALSLVDEARADLDRTGGGTDGPGLAVRAELLRALALSSAGRPPDDVDAALASALAIAPDLTADPVEYPPWLRERLATLSHEAPTPVALELRGAPGAEARIDGAPACVLPCVRDLPVGPHRIRVERAARRSFVTSIDLREPTAVDVTLEPDVRTLAERVRTALSTGQDPADARAAFERIVWAERRSDAAGGQRLVGVLLQADAADRRATVRVSGTGPAAVETAARALVRALTSPATASRRTRPRAPPPPPTPAWWQRPWVWVVAGAVVVAGGVGIAVAASPSSSSGDFQPVLRTP